MKGKEFSGLLTALVSLLRGIEANEAASALNAIVPIFTSAASRNVSDICSVVSGIQPPRRNDELRLQDMLRLFPALRDFLLRAKANKTSINDLDALSAALKMHGESSPIDVRDAAIKRLREQEATAAGACTGDLVDSYARRLEAALNDETQFGEIFRELKANAAFKPQDARKLAKIFAKETAKSKEQAFKLIWARHAALMGSRARQNANKGRTAA